MQWRRPSLETDRTLLEHTERQLFPLNEAVKKLFVKKTVNTHSRRVMFTVPSILNKYAHASIR
jgi:hypothetical protein